MQSKLIIYEKSPGVFAMDFKDKLLGPSDTISFFRGNFEEFPPDSEEKEEPDPKINKPITEADTPADEQTPSISKLDLQPPSGGSILRKSV
jgi:hypothetical protein